MARAAGEPGVERGVFGPLLRSPVAWVVLAGLAVRVGWVVFYWQRNGAALQFPDEQLHWDLAENLALHGVMVSEDGRLAARMPGYPLFLALFAGWETTGVLLARSAQAALGAVNVWLAARIGGAAFGRRAAIVAAVLVALDPWTVFFANLLLTEIVFITVALVFVWGGVRLVLRGFRDAERDASGFDWGATAMVALGGMAAIMIRPSAALWIPAGWLLLLILARFRGVAWLRVGVCAAVLAGALLPWGLRNKSLLGGYAWLSANGGVTLYDAQGPQALGDSEQSFMRELPELRRMGELERDAYLRRKALDQMRADPWRVVELAGIKFVRMWNPLPNVEAGGARAAIVSAAHYLVVIPCAFVGLALVLRRGARGRRRAMMLIWLPVVYFTLLHMAFIGSVRYRIPLMPMLAISAGAAAMVRADAESGPDDSVNGGAPAG